MTPPAQAYRIDIASLAAAPDVTRARHLLRESDDETISDLIAIAEIPAPPFGEAARGAWIAARLEKLGLTDVAIDDVGNVLARLRSSGADGFGAPVILAAHLDTVFPDGTDVRVRREGGRLIAPGVADNARGLAALLAIARALVSAGVTTRQPLAFAATVGEEGVGDLRGVKQLFRDGSPWRRAAAFVGLDGTGRRRIVHHALGSRRLRARVAGPGGHSWADWGRANPAHAVGIAIAALARINPPRHPRAVLGVGRLGGGTSVNAIPEEAWLEIDVRSEDAAAIAELEAQVRRSLAVAVDEVNRKRRRGSRALTLTIELIGERPTGQTNPALPLVIAAREATRFIGETPELVASSTDANVPIALGIPAITIGAGGESGGTHTLEEWYANEGGPAGIERAMLTVLAVAGVD